MHSSPGRPGLRGAEGDGRDSGDVLGFLGQDVCGSGWEKLLVLAVLTSAAASTQTTILPTARVTLSMSRAGAAPRWLGVIHPRWQTPWLSTLAMGIVSAVRLGFGSADVIGVGLILLGVALLVWARLAYPRFFQRRRETADASALDMDSTVTDRPVAS